MNRRLIFAMSSALFASAALRLARAQAPPSPLFSPEQLDQMLAPIALYPDALLAQMLMAATYPLEIVEAARWTRDNPNLHGSDAVSAIANLDWDVSVKSLVAFPQVLAQMDAHLDWTQKLGDAELGQPQDVADSIQRLRAEAAAAGNLQSGPQYVITTEGAGEDIQYLIALTNPEIVFVPFYNPLWVYGRWRWVSYPPFYWPPLAFWGYGPVLAAGFMWGVGLSVRVALFGGWTWRRGHGFININVQQALVIDRHFDRARYANNVWTHDPDHRRGVAYRTPQQAEQFHQVSRSGVEQREPFRGHTANVEAPSRSVGQSQPVVNREVVHTPATGGPTPPNPQVLNQSVPGSQHTNALSGVNRGTAINRESERGQMQQQRVAQHVQPAPPHPALPPPARPK